MPILILALVFVPLFLSSIKDSEVKRIVVIDPTGKYGVHLQSSDHYQFDLEGKGSEDARLELGGDIFGILQITNDLSVSPDAVTLVSEKQAPKELTDYINAVLSDQVKDERLKKLTELDSVDPQVIKGIENILNSSNSISVATLRVDQDGVEREASASAAAGIGIIFTFLMYMFIMMYGTIVMNGVVEEKSNRIVEVMISSVRPFDLMMGKIIGIGLTGLTQLFTWLVICTVILNLKSLVFPSTDLAEVSPMLANLSLLTTMNWVEILGFFLILFIGGYLVYASIFAMFGAAVDSPQDTQQFVMPTNIVFIFALYAGIYSSTNPDGPLAFWCSMIPLTSPIVMMVRIPFGVPLWEKLLSLVILYLTIYFVIKAAAKIYRIGILMYGKKPNIKEIIKWFSYK